MVRKVQNLSGDLVVWAPVGSVTVGVILSSVFDAIVHDGRGQCVGLVADEALAVKARVGRVVAGSVVLVISVATLRVRDSSVILGGRRRGGRVRLLVVLQLDGAVVTRRLRADASMGVLGGSGIGHGPLGVTATIAGGEEDRMRAATPKSHCQCAVGPVGRMLTVWQFWVLCRWAPSHTRPRDVCGRHSSSWLGGPAVIAPLPFAVF